MFDVVAEWSVANISLLFPPIVWLRAFSSVESAAERYSIFVAKCSVAQIVH